MTVKKRAVGTGLALILYASLVGCGPISERGALEGVDLAPPTLLRTRTLDGGRVEILFDEPTFVEIEQLRLVPPLPIVSAESENESVILRLEGQSPGEPYTLRGTVRDERGNSMDIVTTFYGHNPDVPDMRINEFTPRGGGNHPDALEILVLKGGNMGGAVLYQGTGETWRDRLVFPAFTVRDGDYIVVHFKPEGLPEEVDETESKSESGGLDASDTAFDFWLQDSRGIGGNNGVLTLYEKPGGALLDGVLYSNRTSESDERYLGFGTRDVMNWALELAAAGGWAPEDGRIRPEDGVNPEGSTGTRSICRMTGRDTDTRHDWYIVPTRGASFGRENTQEVYAP